MKLQWDSAEDRQRVLNRLRRIEGQARGIVRMIEEDRDCEEIIGQMAAMRSALNRAAMTILTENLMACLMRDGQDQEQITEKAKDLFIRFG